MESGNPCKEVVIDGVAFPTCYYLAPLGLKQDAQRVGWLQVGKQGFRIYVVSQTWEPLKVSSVAEEAPEQGSAHRSPRANSGLHLFL